MPAHSATRINVLLITGLAALCVGLALLVDPGPFSIDEATYQHMVQSFLDGHGVRIWNGYEEYPSPELTSRWIRESGGHLYGQYPFLYVLLAAPFQAALGFRGLFVVNALAFVTSTWLCFRLSRQLLGSLTAAYLGACLFAIASFAGNYAVAAWPHALAVALVLGGASLAASAWAVGDGESRQAIGAGACLGLALGVRIDTALVVPVVLAPFVLARPLRWRTLLGFGLGALVPLAASSVCNGLRWGDWSPVSYGRSVMRVWPVALALGGAAAVGALLRFRERLGPLRRPRVLLGAAGLLLVPILLREPLRELVAAWGRGLWTLVVDLSALPTERAEPGMSRSAEGAVIYFGTLKKALLQSCPYLTVLIVLAARARSSRGQRNALALLLTAAALVAVFYARTSWHGGLSFNLRYLCSSLPFLAIAAGYALARLAEDDARAQVGVAALVAASAFAATLWLAPWRFSAEQGHFWFSRAPLGLAVLVGLSSLAWLLRPSRATARVCSALACLGAALAASAGLAYDTPRAQGVRSINYTLAEFIGENVEDDSLVFVHYPDLFYALIESRRIRIAIPANDRFRDMTALTDFHLARGRAVYAVFDATLWRDLDQTPASRRYRMRPLVQAGPHVLRRLLPLRDGPARVPAASAAIH
jgi:hypothetical protein